MTTRRLDMSVALALVYVRALTEAGPRPTGSAAYQRAAEWSVNQVWRIGLAPSHHTFFTSSFQRTTWRPKKLTK